jgi:mRNA interferase MazF
LLPHGPSILSSCPLRAQDDPVQPRIKAAPKLRQIYWCDYWKDARLPEMWKTRPVIVISYKNTLTGPCLVVPVSIDIEGDGVTSWAVCNHPTTLSPSRFSQFRGNIPLLPKADFNQVLERLMKWLPQPFSLDP